MPVKIILSGNIKGEIKEVYPRIIHKFFFDILDENFRETIHSYEKKPFSLFFKIKDSTLLLEINILEDKLITTFFSNIFNFAILQKSLSYFQGEEKIDIYVEPQNIKIKTYKKYEEILKETKTDNDFLIEIKTPFSFKRYDYDYFLPDPVLVLENLRKKFNLFSPIKINFDEQEKEDILKNFVISGMWGSSKKVNLNQSLKLLGFKGRVLFHYKGKNENLKNKIHNLFIFSTFSGLGRKNTMGMGKVIYDF